MLPIHLNALSIERVREIPEQIKLFGRAYDLQAITIHEPAQSSTAIGHYSALMRTVDGRLLYYNSFSSPRNRLVNPNYEFLKRISARLGYAIYFQTSN